MELSINESKMKELLKEALIEMMKDKKEIFYEIVKEAIEDVGMANAIKEGRQNKFVEEQRIIETIEG